MTSRNIALFLVLIVLGIMLGTPAYAQTSRLYFAGYLGMTGYEGMDFSNEAADITGSIDLEEGYAYAGALGLRLSKKLRMEAELNYSNTDMNELHINGGGSFGLAGDLTSWTGLVNMYYDFDVPWKVKPFVGGGLGIGWHDAVITDVSGLSNSAVDDTLNLMWQIGGGLKYRVNPEMAFTGAYRYVDGGDLEFGTYDIDYGGHEIRFGLEYDLPAQ
jgi:opacity protein-like surface antigen